MYEKERGGGYLQTMLMETVVESGDVRLVLTALQLIFSPWLDLAKLFNTNVFLTRRP